MSFRILSLNVWGGRLHDVLIPYLSTADADVLCLQEVTRSSGAGIGWLSYRDGAVELPQRANLFGELCAALPDHDAFFAPAARGTLFDGATPQVCEFGLATFVRRPHAVVGQVLDFIHGQFSPDGWGEHPRPRNAHCLRIMNYRSGRIETVAHLHGLRDPAGKGDTPARAAQASALVQLLRRGWTPGEPLVLCGDFNVLPDSITFHSLAQLGLVDLVTSRGFSDTRTSHYAKPERFADYLLVTPEVAVAAFDVIALPEVSDHRALRLDIG